MLDLYRNKIIFCVAALIVLGGALGVYYLQDIIKETRYKLSAEPKILVTDIQNTQRQTSHLLLKHDLYLRSMAVPTKGELNDDIQRLLNRWQAMRKMLLDSSLETNDKVLLVEEGAYFYQALQALQSLIISDEPMTDRHRSDIEDLLVLIEDQSIYISTQTSSLVFRMGVKQAEFLSLLGLFLTTMIVITSVVAMVAATLLVKVFGQKEKLDLLIRQDSLTALGNRRAFEEHLAISLARARRFAEPFTMLLLDMDNFKKYNDTYGHLQGDMALKTIAKVLKRKMNRAEDLAFRLGGEEFICLFSASSPESATKLAKDIIKSVRALDIEHETNLPEKYITISGGLIHLRDLKSFSPKDMYRLVDKALYQSKERGRNQVTVYKFGENEVIPHATLK